MVLKWPKLQINSSRGYNCNLASLKPIKYILEGFWKFLSNLANFGKMTKIPLRLKFLTILVLFPFFLISCNYIIFKSYLVKLGCYRTAASAFKTSLSRTIFDQNCSLACLKSRTAPPIYNAWTRRVGRTRRVHSWHPQPPLGFVTNSASSYELVEFTRFYAYLLQIQILICQLLINMFPASEFIIFVPPNPPFVCSKLKTIIGYNLTYFGLKQV